MCCYCKKKKNSKKIEKIKFHFCFGKESTSTTEVLLKKFFSSFSQLWRKKLKEEENKKNCFLKKEYRDRRM